MTDAVTEYEQHRAAPDKWALGRFVVPFSRWTELRDSRQAAGRSTDVWPVSVLATPADADLIQTANSESETLRIEAIETKASSGSDVPAVASLVRQGLDVFVEPGTLSTFQDIVLELKRAGASAKIRTGGITADAFPGSRQVSGFLTACRDARLRFKATAGLHHAVRGAYRLTYDPSPPTGEMFGFLNIAVAATAVWFGLSDELVLEALEERSADAFDFTAAGLRWHNEQWSLAELHEVRQHFFVGFGSCSFREPMAELGLESVPRR